MKMPKWAKLVFVGLAVIIVFFGSAFLLGRRPSDASLVKRFQDNKATFEKLRFMMEEDAQIGQLADWGVTSTNDYYGHSWPQTVIPQKRYEEYMTLLKSGGIKKAYHVDNGDTGFIVAAWGFGGEGWRIAVIWCHDTPKPLVASLDDFGRTPETDYIIFRALENHWYLRMIH